MHLKIDSGNRRDLGIHCLGLSYNGIDNEVAHILQRVGQLSLQASGSLRDYGVLSSTSLNLSYSTLHPISRPSFVRMWFRNQLTIQPKLRCSAELAKFRPSPPGASA